jgi:type II secretory pathway pseudopilin PulG
VTTRDRTLLMVVAVLAGIAAFWFLAISPKRKEASDLGAQITSAQQTLASAQAAAASAQAAHDRYDRDYATVARLGKAVPETDDVPALVYQLESTAHDTGVDFRRISLTPAPAGSAPTQAQAVATAAGSSTTPGTTGTASAAASALPPGAAIGSAGFPTMPFAFDFQGSFFGMQKFLDRLSALTKIRSNDSISVKGRLLTVDGVSIKASAKGFPNVLATVTATAYLLPADEGLTAGATTTAPPAGTGSSAPAATTSLKGSN